MVWILGRQKIKKIVHQIDELDFLNFKINVRKYLEALEFDLITS